MRHGASRAARLGAVALSACVALAAAAQPAAVDPLAQARAATERREFAPALALYERLLAQRPTDADLLIEVARVHGYADRNRESAALYRRALAAAPARRADILPSLAWQTLWSNEPAAAIPMFDELAASGADRFDALDGLGQARLLLGDNAGALQAFQAALALRPDDLAIGRRAALALLWSGREAEAVVAFDALAARHPNDRAVQVGLANARNFAGRHRAAITTFEQLPAPLSGGEKFDLARAYAWAGFEDHALPLLEGQTDPEAVWLREYRVRRELQNFAFARIDHALDRDGLETNALVLGAGARFADGSSLESRLRHVAIRNPSASDTGTEVQAQWRWRLGNAAAPDGTLWPSVALRLHHYRDWSPVTGTARLTWLPRDAVRVDAEVARELIETPTALANRVSVDVASLGADWHPAPLTTLTASGAVLGFDDGNQRLRWLGRAEQVLLARPRWSVGAETFGFQASRPSSDSVPDRGYWNPKRYAELRGYTALTWEQRPWDVSARLALGASREVDGNDLSSTGHPNAWELSAGYDLMPALRLKATLAGSGGGLGLTRSGGDYWRRTAGLSLTGWF